MRSKFTSVSLFTASSLQTKTFEFWSTAIPRILGKMLNMGQNQFCIQCIILTSSSLQPKTVVSTWVLRMEKHCWWTNFLRRSEGQNSVLSPFIFIWDLICMMHNFKIALLPSYSPLAIISFITYKTHHGKWPRLHKISLLFTVKGRSWKVQSYFCVCLSKDEAVDLIAL